jgi:hypothetical protein
MRPEKKEKKKKKTRAPRYYVPKEEEGVPVINAWEFEDCQVVEGGRERSLPRPYTLVGKGLHTLLVEVLIH